MNSIKHLKGIKKSPSQVLQKKKKNERKKRKKAYPNLFYEVNTAVMPKPDNIDPRGGKKITGQYPQ